MDRIKALFCATVDFHFQKFHLPYLKWFKEQGWEVHVAASGEMELPYVDEKYNISIQRSPFKADNYAAYKQLKKIIDDNQYKLIHCHTPMGGVLARLAARSSRKFGTKVIYTAHGFHFCKGAPLFNWLLYYPIEKGLARNTDCLITINQEDYHLADERRFRAARVEHVHGVGIDTERFKPVEESHRHFLRRGYGYSSDDILMFYAAEFNKNKNQRLLIEALAILKEDIPKAKLLLAGDGPLFEECRKLSAELGVEEMVDFLGYQDDIEWFVKQCDIAVASSFREGLPVNIMEAMACGLPILATKNRGHSELIENEVNGFVVEPGDRRNYAAKMLRLYQSREMRLKMGAENVKKMNWYTVDQVGAELRKIYKGYMGEDARGPQIYDAKV